MMNAADAEPLSLLELIDKVQRLGMTYKFEEDINRALQSIISLGNLNDRAEKNLYATSLSFRLLRQHGFHVSQDLFNSFKDNEGKFKSEFRNVVPGMLSLYEASHLAFEGESLMDEAKAFSRTQLKNLKEGLRTSMGEKISHVLELPYHQGLHRLEARWYVDTHDKNYEIRNPLLLELAKLDFNMVQTLHRQELRDMSRWWKEIGLAKKLSFARNRLMESIFWSLGMVPDARFSKCRKQLPEVVKLITVLDDIYDVYGTLDELELFTDVVQRWDVNAIDTLLD
ncbi:hypothetical protein L6164_022261 [Bauhinia variegata]|uniref:Uncharacterized protein n=1 Tax=Bauhinia variegata TaxID=167791 RepID=A0ACB9MGI5_BAUVA|nr:hypothetical protein L6164_022261 [Bauhinia variegata]